MRHAVHAPAHDSIASVDGLDGEARAFSVARRKAVPGPDQLVLIGRRSLLVEGRGLLGAGHRKFEGRDRTVAGADRDIAEGDGGTVDIAESTLGMTIMGIF